MTPDSLLKLVMKAADDKKALELIAIDMNGFSFMAAYFVICHGNSEKQVQAIVKEIKEVAHENGLEVQRVEGYEKARWVLVDLGNVIAHVFHRDERSYYNLEKLWGDAKTYRIHDVLDEE